MFAPPPRPSRRARLLRALGWGLLCALVALGLLLALFDWNWIRPSVIRYLEGNSHREVRIDDLHVSFSPTLAPTVRLRGVRIANADWAEEKKPMAVVGEVSFVFESLRTLFFDEQSRIALLQVRDGDIDMERKADGLRNWRLRDPEYRGPGRFLILRIEAYNSKLHVTHLGLPLRVDMSAASAPAPGKAADGRALPNLIRYSGDYDGSPFSGEVLTTPVFSLQASGDVFPLDGYMLSRQTRFEIRGTMADFLKVGMVDAQMRVQGSSLALLHPFVRGQPPGSRPYQFAGHLRVNGDGYALDDFRGKLGESELAGSASVTRSGRRVWTAQLHSDSARPEDFTTLSFTSAYPREPGKATGVSAVVNPGATGKDAGKDAGKGGDKGGVNGEGNGAGAPKTEFAPPGPAPIPGRIFSNRRLGSERLGYSDAHVTLEVRRFNSPDWPALQSMRATVDLRDGVMRLEPFEIGLAGGRAVGKLQMDGKPHPATANIVLDFQGVRLQALMPRSASTAGSGGPLSAHLDLASSGDTLAQMFAHASGSLRTRMDAGRISDLADAALSLNGGKLVWLKLTGDKSIALNCAQANIDFRDGIGRSRSLLVDTEKTRATGVANIDLREERFDLRLVPSPKESRVIPLGSAIHAFGSFKQADYKIERGEVAGAAGMAAGDSCAAAPMHKETAQAH